MNATDGALKALADIHGVHSDFYDFGGRHHPTNPDSMRALLAALGVDASTGQLVNQALQNHAGVKADRIMADEHVVQANALATLHVDKSC
jgi:4-alpha-glucanotransferase